MPHTWPSLRGHFVAQYKALFPNSNPSPDPAILLNKVVANLKSANPALKFGATIYEDDLTRPYLQDARLPSATRAQFDYVHLFIHYREDGPNFEQAVQQAKQVFPNALIIAGSYAVDRRAFLPCSLGGQPCTTQQELDLFSQSLTIQVKLLVNKEVDSIEFFPGYFGNEDQWPGLSNPRECATGDQANCIANTKAMRQAALTILGGGSPPDGSNFRRCGPLWLGTAVPRTPATMVRRPRPRSRLHPVSPSTTQATCTSWIRSTTSFARSIRTV